MKIFCVIKEGKSFWSVYEKDLFGYSHFKNILTSGNSLSSACKKAKLLQIGYDIRKNLV